MSLGKFINEARKYEQLMNDKIRQVIDILSEDMAKTELDGVTRLSNFPKCTSVKLSTVMNNNFNLSPRYYISEIQTEEIINRVEKMHTLTQIYNLLDDVYKHGYIKKGADKMVINTAVKDKTDKILMSF